MKLAEINQISWILTAKVATTRLDDTMNGKIRELLMHLSSGKGIEDFRQIVLSYRPQAPNPRIVAEKKRLLNDFYNDFKKETSEMTHEEMIQTLRYILWELYFYSKSEEKLLRMGMEAEKIQFTGEIERMIKKKENRNRPQNQGGRYDRRR